MVATNESPVFVKVEGLILITAAVISLVFTFLDSVRLTETAIDLGLDKNTILFIRAAIAVIMIVCTYGLMMKSRLCWILILAGLIALIRFNLSNYDMLYNLVPLIAEVLALLTMFRPSVIRYVFRLDKPKKTEAETAE